jgi:hypothetical protein
MLQKCFRLISRQRKYTALVQLLSFPYLQQAEIWGGFLTVYVVGAKLFFLLYLPSNCEPTKIQQPLTLEVQ